MPATSRKIIHVLAIEDRAGDFRSLRALLATGARAAYQVDRIDSRAAALEAARRGEHDVALLAASTGDRAALDFLREATAQNNGMPIILLVAKTDAAFEAEALQAGAAECLDLATLKLAEVERAIYGTLQHAVTQAELRECQRQLARRAAGDGPRSRTDPLLHSVLRHLPVIAGQLDTNGQVTDARGASRLPASLRPERLIGRAFAELFPPSRGPIAEALAGGATRFTLTGQTRGQQWHAEFFATFDREQGAGAIFLGHDVTDRHWLEVNLLGASDAEQKRLGTDLHDGLGQQLTGLAFMAAALRDRLKVSLPAEVEAADGLARLTREAVGQSRALSRSAQAVTLEKHGLAAALEELAAQSASQHDIHCRFKMRGAPPAGDFAAALHLYRLAQEAIRNAVRHGAAHEVVITLVSRGPAHRLTITDDGSGFDPAHAQAAGMGRGLRLMNYRAEMIGGTLSVVSRPGHGARVACLFTRPSSHENESISSDFALHSEVAHRA